MAGRWEYQPHGILDRTHLRFYTLTEIRALLRGMGLEVETLKAKFSAPTPGTDVLRQVVERFGGDGAQFEKEASVIQYLIVARFSSSATTP